MNKIKFLANYYGKLNQELKLQEELTELHEEINYNIITDGVSENTSSEIADVFIMISQLIYLYDIQEDVKEEIKFKLNRQIDRIKNTKY